MSKRVPNEDTVKEPGELGFLFDKRVRRVTRQEEYFDIGKRVSRFNYFCKNNIMSIV